MITVHSFHCLGEWVARLSLPKHSLPEQWEEKFLLYLNQKLSDFLKMKAICVHSRKFGKFFFSSHLLAPSPKNHS